jgi:hypothetical protein
MRAGHLLPLEMDIGAEAAADAATARKVRR